MTKFKRTSQELVADHNFFKVVTNYTQVEETQEIFDRISIDHIGAVAVIPILANGDIVLIDQYRSTIDDYSLEAVAGRRDVEGEEPGDCALRELQEEVGVKSDRVESLGWIYTSPGFTNEKLFLFIALDCDDPQEPSPVGVEEKYAKTIRCTFEDALNWINEGKIRDSKSIVAIIRAYEYCK